MTKFLRKKLKKPNSFGLNLQLNVNSKKIAIFVLINPLFCSFHEVQEACNNAICSFICSSTCLF